MSRLIKRIFSRCVEDERTGCIEWQGTSNRGYGHIRFDGSRGYVHRLVWVEMFGAIEGELQVCHKCDNRKCVNPDHLFIGTAKDNAADRDGKGRANTPRGEFSGAAKLTLNDVAAIRADDRTHNVIASSFGVARSTVSMIKSGSNWRHA